MDKSAAQTLYREYLESLTIGPLRVLARRAGVPARDCAGNKEKVIASIVSILCGETMPQPRGSRGAPVKQDYLDPDILHRLDQIRRSLEKPETGYENVFEVAASEPARPDPLDEPIYTGVLEIMQNGYGFLRAKNCQPSKIGNDVFIAAPLIHTYKLREGDFVACTAKPRTKNDSPAIDRIISVNGYMIGKYEKRPAFDALTAKYATEKIELSEGNNTLSLRVLDLFAPLGKGQRALIIAPPKAGKTTILKDIARAISDNHGDIILLILLIDERPEEVTDIRSSVEGAQVIYSTFDEGAEHHIRAAELTMAHAKRLAEMGRDVVILLDSLTKLTRAYNNITESTGKTLSGGLDAGALAEPKRFFGAARATKEAGSVTVIATALVETGSRMDDIIYEEFKGTGNADVFLSRDLAERRIFPAIDIRRSGTRKEEFLLTEEELNAVYKLREKGLTENTAGILDTMKRTADNAEFVARLPEWLRVYKS